MDLSDKLNAIIEMAMEQVYEEEPPDKLDNLLKQELRRCIPTTRLQRKFDKLTQDVHDLNKIQETAQRLISLHAESIDVLFLALQENGLSKNVLTVDPFYKKDFDNALEFCKSKRLRFDSFLAAIMRHLPFGPFVEKYGFEIEYEE